MKIYILSSAISPRGLTSSQLYDHVLALRQIRLTPQALLTLVRAMVVSKVDYCNSVLAGVSAHLLDRLQSVLNADARLIFFSARKSERIISPYSASPLLSELHWLRVPEGKWTTRGYANSRTANSRTGHLADWSTRD